MNDPALLAVRAITRLFRRAIPSDDGIGVQNIEIAGLPARIYTPEGAKVRFPIAFFHGGGFIAGELDSHDALCRHLCAAAGAQIVAIEYRLAPEHPAPAQLEDALAACEWVLSVWLRDKPAGITSDATQIIVCGDSAGGYLAMRCAAELNRHTRQVACQLLLYPLMNLDDEHWANHPSILWRPFARLGAGLIRSRLAGSAYPPISQDEIERMPPTVIVAGGALDPVFIDAESMHQRIQAGGGKSVFSRYPRLLHGELNYPDRSRLAAAALESAGMSVRTILAEVD